MKKIFALLFALALCFSVCGCGNNSGMDKETEYVIKSFFAQENYADRMAYLDENYTNYPKLTTEEIEAVIEGDWLQMNIEAYTCEDWWTYEFDDGEREQRMHYFANAGDLDRYDVDEHPRMYKVKDDVLYIASSPRNTKLSDCMGFEIYKMHENFYFLKKVQGDVYEYSSNDYIFAQLDTEGNLVYDNPAWEEYEMYLLFK